MYLVYEEEMYLRQYIAVILPIQGMRGNDRTIHVNAPIASQAIPFFALAEDTV